MGKYDDIIERLEKADGPSRELDWHIGYAVDFHDADAIDYGVRRVLDSYGIEYALGLSSKHNNIWSSILPQWSSSLDAAISLTEKLLPGHYRELSGPRKYLNIPTPVPGKFRAEVTTDEGFDSYRAIGWGETEPIAFLIALFRALQAQERE